MFKKLTDIITSDCEVVKLTAAQYVYPIFKNGRSSIYTSVIKNKLKLIKNQEISKLKNITIFLRCPKDRFVSGVHTFFYLKNNKIIDEYNLKKIENLELVDRHFAPQYLWLLHLRKYFDGMVYLRPTSELYDIVPYRDGPWTNNTIPWQPMTLKIKEQILSINHKQYIDIDEKIIRKYMHRSIDLKILVKEFKN